MHSDPDLNVMIQVGNSTAAEFLESLLTTNVETLRSRFEALKSILDMSDGRNQRMKKRLDVVRTAADLIEGQFESTEHRRGLTSAFDEGKSAVLGDECKSG
jgi:hypothetical protein